MTSTRKSFGVLLAAAALATTALQADDKPAATNDAPKLKETGVDAVLPAKAPPANGAPKPAAAAKPDDLFPDPVIAKGNGFEIKRSRMDEAISGVRAAAIARGRELTPADLPLIEKSTLDHLLEVQLLLAKAADTDKAKAREEADRRFETIKKRAPSEEALASQLKSINLTLADFHNRLLEETTAEQVLRDKVSVTDEQAKKFYDDNPSQFEQPEMVRVSHILISTGDPRNPAPMSDNDKKARRKIAEDVLKRARANEDFAKLAREYSDDTGSKENGGEITVARGTMANLKEFEAAAFTLQTNQISDIVTTQFGHHIIKLSEKFPARKHELAEEIPNIKIYLERLEMEKILPELTAKLRKEADVQILDEHLKALEQEADAASKSAPGKDTAPK